jgi:hypothetical protein
MLRVRNAAAPAGADTLEEAGDATTAACVRKGKGMRRIKQGATLVISTILLLSVLGTSAAAEVVSNARATFVVVVTNPCAPEDGPITQTVHQHTLVRIANDGTIFTHQSVHSEGVSANGTKYIANRQNFVENAPGPAFSATFRIHRISAGSSDNAYIVVTITAPPPSTVTVVDCSG